MTTTPQEPDGQGRWDRPGQGDPTADYWGQPLPGGQPLQAPGPGGYGAQHPQDLTGGQTVWRAPDYQGAPPPWQSQFGQNSGDRFQAGQPWPRLGARLLDSLILTVPSALLLIPTLVWFVSDIEGSNAEVDTTAGIGPFLIMITMVLLVLPILQLLYVGYFGGVKGATPGKRALGLRICNPTSGEPIGFWACIGREIVLDLACSILVGYFTIWFDETGRLRGWHDLAVNSRVVKA